eukprot:1359376-Pyramimonas_sp.AAC.1
MMTSVLVVVAGVARLRCKRLLDQPLLSEAYKIAQLLGSSNSVGKPGRPIHWANNVSYAFCVSTGLLWALGLPNNDSGSKSRPRGKDRDLGAPSSLERNRTPDV